MSLAGLAGRGQRVCLWDPGEPAVHLGSLAMKEGQSHSQVKT